MKLIPQRIEILTEIPKNLNQRIERIGRVCYKSEEKITPTSAETFVKNLIKNGHESVLEHFSVTARFITDRGISHEIVRHRIASYSQESTRYCNYGGKDIEFITPPVSNDTNNAFMAMTEMSTILNATESYYHRLIAGGVTPQIARAALPNALKTEIVMTANLREWRHFFKLRCSPKAHPQMRELAISLLYYFIDKAPLIYSDLVDPTWSSPVKVDEAFNI